MNRIISLVLCFSLLCSSSFAGPSNSFTLKDAIDDLNYALEVEWDQKDTEFYAKQMELFNQRIEGLNLSGKSHSELIQEALKTLPDNSNKKDLVKLLSIRNVDALSKADFHKELIEISKKSGQTGASWNSDVDLLIPAALVIVVIALVMIVSSKKDEPKKPFPTAPQTPTNPTTPTTPVDPTTPIEPTTPAPSTPEYRCELRNTCMPGIAGPGFDDYGIPLGSVGGLYDSSYCGYQFICGFFL